MHCEDTFQIEQDARHGTQTKSSDINPYWHCNSQCWVALLYTESFGQAHSKGNSAFSVNGASHEQTPSKAAAT